MILDRIKQFFFQKKLKQFLERFEWMFMPLMLLFGVSTDFYAFQTLDIAWVFYWLGLHIVLAGIYIAILNRPPSKSRWMRYIRLVTPLLLQLSFGALLNASLVFYWFSGALSVSWFFFVVILILMVSNDVFRHYFVKPTVQLGVYFFALFSVFALILPFLVNSIDPFVFVAAGAGSVVFFLAYLFILSRFCSVVRSIRSHALIILFVIFAIMNTLYFLNLIPPIPLSLREAGVYHSISRVGDGYQLLGEQKSWISQFLPGETIHVFPAEKVYVYTSIFAPDKLKTTIVHHWEFYDETKKVWIDKDYLSFAMNGGRNAGYRGYSFKYDLAPGKWRVTVETARGQVLGRVGFDVLLVTARSPLQQIKK